MLSHYQGVAQGLTMTPWMPVFAALLGAIVTGTLLLLAQWLSNRRQQKDTKLKLAEERAQWAAERRLEHVQRFYAIIEKLQVVTGQFRVQQAWARTLRENPGETAPPWVPSYDKARGEWEDHLGTVRRELLLLDDEVRGAYGKANIDWLRWMRSKTDDESVETLVAMESDIRTFFEWLAEYYRKQFTNRLKGLDHAT